MKCMKCDVSAVESAVKKLESSTRNLESAIMSDWDDAVKQSYKRYISQCKSEAEKARNVVSKMKSESNNLASVKLDSIINSADAVCKSIQSV